MTDFTTVVKTRRSVRHYLPTPVPEDILTRVLDAAQCAPSNCNTQPWHVHILSGDINDAFSKTILEAHDAGEDTTDFSFPTADFFEFLATDTSLTCSDMRALTRCPRHRFSLSCPLLRWRVVELAYGLGSDVVGRLLGTLGVQLPQPTGPRPARPG